MIALCDGLTTGNLTMEVVIGALTTEELEAVVIQFTEIVRGACDIAIPRISTVGHAKSVKWWTDELSELKKMVKTLRRRIKGAHPARKKYAYDNYSKAKAEYKLGIERAITNSWKTFCSQQNREDLWRSSYRVLRKCLEASTRQECLLKSPLDEATLTPSHSAQLLARTFFPEDDPVHDSRDHGRIRREAATLRETARALSEPTVLQPFTGGELDAVLEAMNPSKAPGIDGITSDICQKTHNAAPILLAIYNKCLRLSFFPRAWKSAWIRVIPKPEKAHYTVPKAYRPIGLLPVMGKVLEKMVINRLSWELFGESGLSRRQYGFVPQRSTEDALSDGRKW